MRATPCRPPASPRRREAMTTPSHASSSDGSPNALTTMARSGEPTTAPVPTTTDGTVRPNPATTTGVGGPSQSTTTMAADTPPPPPPPATTTAAGAAGAAGAAVRPGTTTAAPGRTGLGGPTTAVAPAAART